MKAISSCKDSEECMHADLPGKFSHFVCGLCFVPTSHSNLLSGNKAMLAETALLA